jgi:hypothetical protein
MPRRSRFDVVLTTDPSVPPQAWSATVGRGRARVDVRAGSWVEGTEDGVVEGAWSGDYSAGGFATAQTFSGTGLRATADGLVLATSTDTLQAVYVLPSADRLLCSNSLAFLLAAAGEDLDPDYRYYDLDVMTIMFGLRRYRRQIPTKAGRTIRLCYHGNVLVTPRLEVRYVAKPAPPSFARFDAYRAFLAEEINGLVSNAQAAGRKRGYRPLATVSSGYDSPASAVLARAAGCTEAVTFGRARAEFRSREDSGEAIGKILGLRVREFDPEAFRRRTDLPEAEFYATGHGGDDVVMSALEAVLPGRLLFTGYHGDKIWARINSDVGPDIVRGDPSGCSLAEFRLRVGFINVAVPFIGALRHPSIHAISNSAEMQPWSLANTSYDRPIPRRIVEEAGVPREMFGQAKKAVTMPYQRTDLVTPSLETIMSPASHAELAAYAASLPEFAGVVDRATYGLLHRLYRLNARALESYKLRRMAALIGCPWPKRPWVPWRYGKARGWHSVVFHWAMDRTRLRYSTLT